jgi:Flp pilus assembly protein TadG
MVPVLFGFMGFAIDLGRLYLIRGELKTAANAMALAAAQKLIGTDASIGNATSAAQLAIDNSGGFANKYNFGGNVIGETTGNLNSEVSDPAFYDSLASATGQGDSAGASSASGSTARHVRINITADAPLTFWSFLSLGISQKTPVVAQAVAGMSAPLCTACGIEAFAIAALSQTDTTDFGFMPNTRYTFGFVCTGVPTPGLLSGTTQRIPYLILNRFNQNATLFPDETSQIYRIGASGLPPSTDPTQACFQINANEQVWVSAAPQRCANTTVAPTVSQALCGIAARFDPTTIPTQCANVAEVDTIASAYVADSDLTDLDDYTQYTGNTRRVMTVPVVDVLDPAGTMSVLGFRQFLIEPNPGSTTVNPADQDARFVALYIGSVMPVKQGSFSGCQIIAGPGKVVLHQ